MNSSIGHHVFCFLSRSHHTCISRTYGAWVALGLFSTKLSLQIKSRPQGRAVHVSSRCLSA